MLETEIFYIAFFKYQDSSIWQKTNLRKEEDLKELEDYVKNIQYINPDTINIVKIELPKI